MIGNAATSPVDRIVQPQPVDIRSLWPREDRDFTPWLAGHLDVLGQVVGLDLQLEAVEQSVPETWRSLDILATAGGRRVAIENQYSQADHDHLTRGLAYAVKLEASALIVVAERHLDEFRAVATYLNACAGALGDDGIRIYLVELAVEAVGEYFVPRFTPVEQPNPWLEERTERAPAIANVDEFLARIEDPGRRATFTEALTSWGTITDRRIAFTTTAAALYLPNPAKGPRGETAVFTLYDYGQCTMNRGYLLDAGLFPTDDNVAELDREIDRYLPTNERLRVPYFVNVLEPAAPGILGFATWLTGWIDSARWQRDATDPD